MECSESLSFLALDMVEFVPLRACSSREPLARADGVDGGAYL